MLNFTEDQFIGKKFILENEDIFTIFKKENGIGFVMDFIRNSPVEFIEANKIFLKILQNIVEREVKKIPLTAINALTAKDEQEEYFSEFLDLIIISIKKFENCNSIIIYLLDIIKEIMTTKKIIEKSFSGLLDNMFNILYKTYSPRIASNCFFILDIILKNSDFSESIRNKNPLNLVVRILTNFQNDNIVSFHACGFLSKVLEKEDIDNFLKIMKIKTTKNSEYLKELDLDNFLPEIKEILSSEDYENKLNSLKKNIIRVLILMSKDKNFLQLLKEINCLDIFIKLLKSDLEIIEEKNKKKMEEGSNKNLKEEKKKESKYEQLTKRLSFRLSKKGN